MRSRTTLDRSCLRCFFHKNQHRLDSEWHSFLDCPLNRASRREFHLLAKLHFVFDGHSSVETLALLIARVRADPLSLNVFCALFSTGERQSAALLQQLSLDAQLAELDAKLNRMFHV